MTRFAILTTLLMAVSLCAFAQEQEKKNADVVAQTWLAFVDKSDFAASWENAATPFKSAVTKTDWAKALTSTRGQFGKLLSRKLKSSTYTTTLPGAPDGKYVVLQYDTSFVNKQSAVETVTPMLDKDGQWRVSGYFVR